MIAMNEELFNKMAQEGAEPVLVEFWAPWCVYCRRIAPAMLQVAQAFEGRLAIAQINIDEEPLLAHKEQIEVIPTLVLYRGGQAVASIVAPESKARIDAFLQENR